MNILEPKGEEEKEIPRLNANDAVRRIEDINDSLSRIQRDLISNTSEYLSSLTKVWGSEKAIIFGNDFVNMIDEIDRGLVYLAETIVNDACRSFNDIAYFRKTRSIYVQAGPFIGANYERFNDSLDKGKGMIPSEVENYTDEYINIIDSLKNRLSGIPKVINFYDVYGSLVKTYKVGLNKINEMIDFSLNNFSKRIQQLINEDIDLTKKALEESISVLS